MGVGVGVSVFVGVVVVVGVGVGVGVVVFYPHFCFYHFLIMMFLCHSLFILHIVVFLGSVLLTIQNMSFQ